MQGTVRKFNFWKLSPSALSLVRRSEHWFFAICNSPIVSWCSLICFLWYRVWSNLRLKTSPRQLSVLSKSYAPYCGNLLPVAITFKYHLLLICPKNRKIKTVTTTTKSINGEKYLRPRFLQPSRHKRQARRVVLVLISISLIEHILNPADFPELH